MKKTVLFISIALISFAASYVIAQSASGQNWVGYVKIAVEENDFALVGVNFESVGGDSGALLSEVISTNNLVAGVNDIRLLSDRVFVWDDVTSGYIEYWYSSVGFRNSEGPADPILDLGDAFWFKSAPNSGSRDIYVLGQVSLSDTNSLSFGGDSTGRFNLFANPYPTDFYLASNDWSNATAGPVRLLSDRIYIWDGQNYIECWLKDDGKWYVGNEEMDPSTSIAAGEGAWYRARADFDQVFNRPFDLD